MAKQSHSRDFSALALLGGGVILVTMTVAGYFIGALIDAKLGTSPKGAIIGLIIGVIAGFVDLYRIAMHFMSRQSMPTRTQQQEAKQQWETSEKPEQSEGGRDGDHA